MIGMVAWVLEISFQRETWSVATAISRVEATLLTDNLDGGRSKMKTLLLLARRVH